MIAIVFRSKGNLGKQIAWYVVAFVIINCIVNSINCVWVAVAGLFVPDWLYNIGTTVLQGGISMVVRQQDYFPRGGTEQAGRIGGKERFRWDFYWGLI